MTTPGRGGAFSGGPSPLRIEITARTMVTAILVVAGAWVVIRLAPVALVLVIALFLVGTLNPALEWLEAKGIKRGVGIAIVFTTMLLVLLGILALTVPALIEQIMSLVQQEPALRWRLSETLSHSRLTAPLANWFRSVNYETLVKDAGPTAFEYSTRSAMIIAYLASTVFLALYIMIDRDRLRGGLYALVPRKHHIRLSRVMLKLEVIVGGYIRGQILTSALMTGFTFLLLSLCGVKSALAIAVVAGVADVLPYVGAFISVGAAVAAAASRGPLIVVIVLLAMIAYEEFESRVLVPRIYGRTLKLPSSVVLLALLTGGTLMGIPGALLALPVAAAVRMLVDELSVNLPGEDVDDSSARASDRRADREYERRVTGVPAEKAAAIAVQIAEERAHEDDAAPHA